MDLISILGINEVEQKLKTQFNLYISWFDFRLKIYNMKTNINLNTLTQEERESIWVPVLVFRNVFINVFLIRCVIIPVATPRRRTPP